MTTISSVSRTLALTIAGALLCGAAASAASTSAAAQARYRQDMAVCNSGQSNQDLATCRREARNALAEARHGGLTAAPDEYERNATQRCSVFKGADRGDCEARLHGQATIQGSVAGGGILRESVTVVPAQ